MEAKLDKSRSSSRALFVIVVLGAMGVTPANAQPPTAGQRQEAIRDRAAIIVAEAQQRVRERRRETTVVYPFGLSGTSLTGTSVTASEDAKTVAITAAISTSKLSELVVKASAPLSEDESRSPTLQLDGLANKGKVGLEWRYGQQRLPSEQDAAELTQKLMAACERTNPEVQGGPETGFAITGCPLPALLQDAGLNQEMERLFPRRAAWFVSIKGDVGAETFKFANPTTFADEKSREYSTSASLVLGWLTASNIYFAVSGRYDHAFEAAKNKAVCTIAGVDQTIACPLKIVGPPTSTTSPIVELEARRYLPQLAGLNFGLSGILRHDFEEANTSFEVPLYFIKDKDGGLSGGVSAGYVWSADQDTKGPRFMVFVGQTFGLGSD
jgi:hypothetical protein